ncbi:probable nucleoporin Nup54 isoform X2 [Cydia strobilella]|uniref:probable nucleoporin Nup54 isoform X2 n=1 Tax=Cydia strobilella TaxID=1100964 RepID=UPI003007801E
MSFNFSPNVPPPVVFGTAAKRTPFGTLAASAASTGASMFGGSTFGTTTTKPTTGFSSFGNTTATSIGGTGSLAFGGGASTFGSTAPTFGSTAPTFGSTAPTFGIAAPTFGSTGPAFGSTAPTFGSTAATFGTGVPAFGSSAPAFGTNTLTTNSFGGTSTGSTFGSTFGQKPATSGFGGFGTGLASAFGQQNQPQQQQQGPGSAHEALVAAVFNCSVFGDERDQVLAKWNLLQAQWGNGHAYYSRNAPRLQLNEQNPLCRFKAVGYSRLGTHEDKDGLVVMMFNKSVQEINTNKQVLQTSLSNLFGNKPNLVVTIDSVGAVTDNKSQVVIYVVDKNANNAHISATELASFLNAGAARTALNGAGCSNITAVTRPTPQALAQYLQTPPPGMDMRLWKQAQADNPDPDNYIPVPIIGFSEIKSRARIQGEEANLQAEWLKRTADTLAELRTRRAAAAARLAQLSAKLHALRHTLLQAIGRKEVMGRVGAALSPEEEAVRARLHELASTLSTPPLYNGRLNELLSAVRLQRSAIGSGSHERYQLDPGAQEDLKQFLTLQQRGMAHLLDTAWKDLDALNTITEGMSRLVRA